MRIQVDVPKDQVDAQLLEENKRLKNEVRLLSVKVAKLEATMKANDNAVKFSLLMKQEIEALCDKWASHEDCGNG